MRVIQPLLDFLELRPFFTLRAIRIFWWIYIAVQLHRLYFQFAYLIERLPYIGIRAVLVPLDALVTIASVRLLLDVVLALAARCTENFGERPVQHARAAELAGGRVRAFFDLGPFYDRGAIAVLWGLVLITQLRIVVFALQSALAMGIRDVAAMDTTLVELLSVAWFVGGVRLLMEVQLAFLTRDGATAERILSN